MMPTYKFNNIIFRIIGLIAVIILGLLSIINCNWNPEVPCSEGYLTMTIAPLNAYSNLTVDWQGNVIEGTETAFPVPDDCHETNPRESHSKQDNYTSPTSVEHLSDETLHIGVWDSRVALIGDNCPTVIQCQHEVRSSGGMGGESHDLTITENSCTSPGGIRGYYLISDFSLYQDNNPPCNWREQWNVDNSDWLVTNGILTGNQTADNIRLLVWSTVPTNNDVEILAKVLTHAKSDLTHAQLHLRASGTTTNMSSYLVGLASPGGTDQLRMRKLLGTTNSILGTFNYSYTVNSWYWIRFRVQGNTVRAKIWADGDVEPTGPNEWQIDIIDNDILLGGWVGVGASSADDDPQFGWFSVGLDGQTAGFPQE